MRTSTASSYSSTSSFIASDPTASSTLSLFSNLLGRSTPETSSPEEAPVRLARTRVDEEKLAHLMISCADTRHVLKTECDPCQAARHPACASKRRGENQLQEAGALRTKLAVAQDTVEDLEDEKSPVEETDRSARRDHRRARRAVAQRRAAAKRGGREKQAVGAAVSVDLAA
ncbi:hypothetical protein L1887_48858 [Cichorium endivia]|nr:hypothetical protein L1887_48858 [Cichorium endivia]